MLEIALRSTRSAAAQQERGKEADHAAAQACRGGGGGGGRGLPAAAAGGAVLCGLAVCGLIVCSALWTACLRSRAPSDTEPPPRQHLLPPPTSSECTRGGWRLVDNCEECDHLRWRNRSSRSRAPHPSRAHEGPPTLTAHQRCPSRRHPTPFRPTVSQPTAAAASSRRPPSSPAVLITNAAETVE